MAPVRLLEDIIDAITLDPAGRLRQMAINRDR